MQKLIKKRHFIYFHTILDDIHSLKRTVNDNIGDVVKSTPHWILKSGNTQYVLAFVRQK